MPIEDQTPGTPAWWRNRLLAKLIERRRKLADLERYYDAGGPRPEVPSSVKGAAREDYEHLLDIGAANWCGVVADAPTSRLEVVGFRFGDTAGDTSSDQDAWTIWQRNQLDADHGLAHAAALQGGSAVALVWGDRDDKAVITIEDPSQVIVAYEPGSRRRRAAALKSWHDDGWTYAVLYLPTRVYKWRCRRTIEDTLNAPEIVAGAWDDWTPPGENGSQMPNPLGEVPAVELRANPRLKPEPWGGGRCEFHRVRRDQDRINQVLFDRLVTGQWLGFPQRWMKGWEPPPAFDPEGNPVSEEAVRDQQLRASRSRVWLLGDDAEAGQLPAADLSQLIKAYESDVATMMATTFTPPYLHPFGNLVNVSTESMQAIDAGFLTKCEAHARNFGEDWEDVLRLGLKAERNPRAADTSSEVIWRDLEKRTWAQTVDAVLKMKDLGVPREALWAMLPDVTPQQVAAWRELGATEALFGDLNALAVTPEPVTAAQPVDAGA